MGNIANRMLLEAVFKIKNRLSRNKKEDVGGEVGRRKNGLAWLNFLYTFFGVEIIYKGILAVGTLYTLLSNVRFHPEESLFMGKNILSMCASVLFIFDVVVKFFALINAKNAEGYTLMVWSLALGSISGSVYLFFDQGFLIGLVFAVLAGIAFFLNYTYVKKRKWVYGNPDLC